MLFGNDDGFGRSAPRAVAPPASSTGSAPSSGIPAPTSQPRPDRADAAVLGARFKHSFDAVDAISSMLRRDREFVRLDQVKSAAVRPTVKPWMIQMVALLVLCFGVVVGIVLSRREARRRRRSKRLPVRRYPTPGIVTAPNVEPSIGSVE